MKKLENYDWNKIGKEKLVAMEGALEKALPILGSIPVVSNKASECLNEVRKIGYVEYKDVIIGPDMLRDIIYAIGTVPRSNFMKSKMTSEPKLASLTPIVMYALRVYQDIPYDYWDREDKFIQFWLGNFLYDALLNPKYKRPIKTREEWLEIRNFYIENGTGARLYGATVKTPRLKGWKKYWEIENVHIGYLHMCMQTWLACEDLRDEESMILNPFEWDDIPSPYVTRVTENNLRRAAQYDEFKF